MGWRQRRGKRALERQLDYQEHKAEAIRGQENETIARMMSRSAAVRAKLEALGPIDPDARVVEVGSGAHGLIFYFGAKDGVGVDPLADHYATLFPAWQGRVRTVAAFGESLPFEDGAFDIVLCDNVVDHAERPGQVVAELARVLAPGGRLYFTVNVHHPFYHSAATLHSMWRALGIPFEITPFADHTVHLTPKAARRLFDGLPLRLVSENATVAQAKRAGRERRPRHAGDRLKRLFYKNALFEAIAVRT
jgi:SAM-dependent methyltransferase